MGQTCKTPEKICLTQLIIGEFRLAKVIFLGCYQPEGLNAEYTCRVARAQLAQAPGNKLSGGI
jgi:hypothetical protein